MVSKYVTGHNNWLYGCMRCFVPASNHDVTMINSYDCSAIATSSALVLNSSGLVLTQRMRGWTINKNGRVLKNGWATINSSTGSALSPYTMNGDSGNKYKVDTTGGDVYVQLDTLALEGESINFKITNSTNNLVLSTSTNTETVDGNALPYTITPTLYDNYVISSDGSNFYIL